MESKPRIQLQLSKLDKSLELTSKILLGLMWMLFAFSFIKLPAVVPLHYNVSGKVDSYGNKQTLLVLPLLATAIYFCLAWLNKYPHIFNYTVTITKENAQQQYSIATRMLRFLKISILLIITLIIVLIYLNAEGYIEGLGIWFLPFTVIIFLVPIIIAISQSLKNK